MRILVAPDSFKGSLTAIQASNIIKSAIQDMKHNHKIITKPMADGGDGTLDILLESMQGELITLPCTGPMGDVIDAKYAIVQSHQAIIEYANIAGLTQVPQDKRNPDMTTSEGLGEVIQDALERGCTTFVIGLGGSATNDGGLGMLLSLGMQAWDESGNEVGRFGRHLSDVAKVDMRNLDPRLNEVDIKIASDVQNPLHGENGASEVYGPQKGLAPNQVKCYDAAFVQFGGLIEHTLGKHLVDIPGAGAAGGLGFGLLVVGGEVISGTEFIADSLGLEQAIESVDLVITGEGKSDEQTLNGKAPGYIAERSRHYLKQVILLSGSLEGDMDQIRQHYSGCFSIINRPLTLDEGIEQAEELLYEQTKHMMHLVENILTTKENAHTC